MELWFNSYEDQQEFIKHNSHMQWHSIVVEDDDGNNCQWIARQNHNGTLELREGEYLYEEINKTMEQITAEQAFIEYKKLDIERQELHELVVRSIKRKLTGHTLFEPKLLPEDQQGRKILRVDAFRVYHPGRNVSTPLEELYLLDLISILKEINVVHENY